MIIEPTSKKILSPTPYFTWAEVVGSRTAAKHGIDNSLPSTLWANVTRMAEFMHDLRELLAQPIRVTSWYRCPELNRLIGGSATSRHLDGLAVDWVPTKISILAAFRRLNEKPRLPFDQLIHEKTATGAEWVHAGLAPSSKSPRGVVLLARGEALGGTMRFAPVV